MQQNESFDSKRFQRKEFQTTELTTSNWDFWYLCQRFSKFYIKWIPIYKETVFQEGYLSILPTRFPANSRHVLKTSSIRLQHNNFLSSKTPWRHLQDILQHIWKTSWRSLGKQKIVTLKTSSRHLEDMPRDKKMFTGDTCLWQI